MPGSNSAVPGKLLSINTLLTDGTLCLLGLLLCLPGLIRAASRRYVLAGMGFLAAYFLLSDLLHLSYWQPELPGHYNWWGKLGELPVDVATLAWLLGPVGGQRPELGLRWTLAPGTGRWVLRLLVPVLLLELVVLGWLVPAGVPSWEDHFFQLTTPGLTEELPFRRVLLALLDRAFPGRVRVLGAALGWGAVVTSLLFGLLHGLHVRTCGHVSVDLLPMAIPLVGGFVLAWCWAVSGSVLLPILVHAGMNELANLMGLAKSLLPK